MGENFKFWAAILLALGLITAIILGTAVRIEYKEYSWSSKTEEKFNTPLCLAVSGASLSVFVSFYAIGCILCHQEEQIELLKKLLGEKPQNTEENN